MTKSRTKNFLAYINFIIILERDSKQPAGCFSLRWTQECNIRGGGQNGNGTEPDAHNYLHRCHLDSLVSAVIRFTWEHGVPDPPWEDNQGALRYDELPRGDVPTGHGAAALPWQTLHVKHPQCHCVYSVKLRFRIQDVCWLSKEESIYSTGSLVLSFILKTRLYMYIQTSFRVMVRNTHKTHGA